MLSMEKRCTFGHINVNEHSQTISQMDMWTHAENEGYVVLNGLFI